MEYYWLEKKGEPREQWVNECFEMDYVSEGSTEENAEDRKSWKNNLLLRKSTVL